MSRAGPPRRSGWTNSSPPACGQYSTASAVWQGHRTAVNRRCWVRAEPPPGQGLTAEIDVSVLTVVESIIS